MKITAIIPSFCRPIDLQKCLRGLQTQTRQPDEIIVVLSKEDKITEPSRVREIDSRIKVITIAGRGQVVQLNAGVAEAEGDILAITDDDAVPGVNWIQNIQRHFEQGDQTLAGVGGRDIVHNSESKNAPLKNVVGRICWYGKHIGNHHLGQGGPRYVDHLKGANMAYRSALLKQVGFDLRLRGSGSQIFNDTGLSLSIRRLGFKLIYDPEVSVDHYAAERLDEDKRSEFNKVAQVNMTHNNTLVILEHLNAIQRIAFLLWGLFVGTSGCPGLAYVLVFTASQGSLPWRRFSSTMIGRKEGFLTWWTSRKRD